MMAKQSSKWIIQEFREDPVDEQTAKANLIEEFAYDRSTNVGSSQPSRSLRRKQQHWWNMKSISHVACELFLPVGYPHTVNPGYIQYQFYDSIQGLCSYLRGVLCSAAVLEAAGVGDETKTAMAAALTWASRDGFAMIGGLAYSYFASHYFDGHVKEFRLFADIINDVGFALDMIAPWVSNTFSSYHGLLWVSSLAVLCKTLCGISAGATKASITQHFAMDGNMADLNAKESTQETFVSLIGMLLGIGAAKILQQYEQDDADKKNRWNWILFISLTILHVIANYKGVELLRMRTLNRARAEIALQNVIHNIASQAIQNMDTTVSSKDNNHKIVADRALEEMIPSPTQVHESLLWSAWHMIYSGPLHLGVPLVKIMHMDPDAVVQLTSTSSSTSSSNRNESMSQKYVIAVAPSCSNNTKDNRSHVLVSLVVGATSRDELQAFVHAQTLLECRNLCRVKCINFSNNQKKLMDETKELIHGLFREDDQLVSALRRKGWDVDGRFYLGFSRKRSQLIPATSVENIDENKKEK